MAATTLKGLKTRWKSVGSGQSLISQCWLPRVKRGNRLTTSTCKWDLMRSRSIFSSLRVLMIKFWFSKTRSSRPRLCNGMRIVSRARRASEATPTSQRTTCRAWRTCKSFSSKHFKTYKALNRSSSREPKWTWVFPNYFNQRKRNKRNQRYFSMRTNLTKL